MNMNSVRGFVVAGLMVGLGGSTAFGQNYVKPGDTVEIPLPITNANDNGEPGGDTISSMKVVIANGNVAVAGPIGIAALSEPNSSGFVTNPTDSETQSIAPGETKIFTARFVVGDVPEGPYTVTLRQVSSDAGIDPDPDDPASAVEVGFSPQPLAVLDGRDVPLVSQTLPFAFVKLSAFLRRATDGSRPALRGYRGMTQAENVAPARSSRVLEIGFIRVRRETAYVADFTDGRGRPQISGTEARARCSASLRTQPTESRPAPDARQPFGPDARGGAPAGLSGQPFAVAGRAQHPPIGAPQVHPILPSNPRAKPPFPAFAAGRNEQHPPGPSRPAAPVGTRRVFRT